MFLSLIAFFYLNVSFPVFSFLGPTFQEKNLDEVVNFRKQYAAYTNRNVVYKLIKEAIEDEKTPKEIIIEIRDINDKNNISEQDTLIMVIFQKIFSFERAKKDEIFHYEIFIYQ